LHILRCLYHFLSTKSSTIGIYRRAVAARASDKSILKKAQDGGVVTAILVYLLEEKIIDGAILTGRGRERDGWMPFPLVARSKEMSTQVTPNFPFP